MFKKICASVLTLVFASGVLSGNAFAQSANDQFQYDLLRQREQEMINQQIYQQNENERRQQGEQSQRTSGSTNSGRSQPTRTVIVDRFGAVAFDNTANSYGYSSNQSSKAEAAQEAIKSCAQSGCRIVGTYANTCAAFAWGKTKSGGITRFEGGTTKEIAEVVALQACNKKAKNCQILMSECSKL
jgi:hypothetical protein